MQAPESEGDPERQSIIAAPLHAGSSEIGAAAVELNPSCRVDHQGVMQVLQWGGQWLGLLRREALEGVRAPLSGVLDLLVATLDHDDLAPSALTLTTELARQFNCDRVSLGLVHGRQIRVYAMSHTAVVDRRANLIRDIEAAMHEAADQDASVAFPPPKDAPPLIAFAHEILRDRAERVAVSSVPLFNGGKVAGVLTFERPGGQHPFTLQQMKEFDAVSALLGPIVGLKHERERSLLWKVSTALSRRTSQTLKKSRWKSKLILLLIVAFLAGAYAFETDYRIAAPATLEGQVQRVITAPHEGFIGKSLARAGDRVEAGDLLATLDDRELRLEALTLKAEREQLLKEKRAALTAHNRGELTLSQARLQKADAQLALIESRIERNEIRAPFSGVLVAGDLSQTLGAPVEHGQTLFEIAPLDAYRVMLQVDERDITDTEPGRSGMLALTGLPDHKLGFDVVRVQPLAQAIDGRNAFLVEAALRESTPALRPGMAGVAKVDVGQRRLLWIWTHSLVDWLHLTWWRWGG